jgi:2-keto-4-pentenoate hydratase/2-oxohepta-3-ene-1,7-dioic acid hydratase in catechol pathway
MDKIICIGKNYLEHAIEMGDAIPEKPVIFLKPPSLLRQATHWGDVLQLGFPEDQSEIHYECEAVFKINRQGYRLSQTEATQVIDAVSLGLDMTLRSLQEKAKKEGNPWTISKVFKDAAVLGPWLPWDTFDTIKNEDFSLTIDGKVKQRANVSQMRLSFIELLVYVSHFFPLCAGDIFFTGTPAGVGPLTKGTSAALKWGRYEYGVQW